MSRGDSITGNSVILSMKKIIVAGIVLFVFLGLLMGIVGFIAAGIMRFLPFLNWQILIALILVLGILVNIFGSQKYSSRKYFGVSIARSVRRFADNIIEKNKNAFRADSVSLDDLFGVTSVRDEMRENDIVIITGLLSLMEDEEVKELLRKATERIEDNKRNRKNCSAAIYVLSADDGVGKKDVLASSSPTPATGFVLEGVLSKWLRRENLMEVVHKITSGALFANQKEEEEERGT